MKQRRSRVEAVWLWLQINEAGSLTALLGITCNSRQRSNLQKGREWLYTVLKLWQLHFFVFILLPAHNRSCPVTEIYFSAQRASNCTTALWNTLTCGSLEVVGICGNLWHLQAVSDSFWGEEKGLWHEKKGWNINEEKPRGRSSYRGVTLIEQQTWTCVCVSVCESGRTDTIQLSLCSREMGTAGHI